jgi:hypothetical protein
MPDTFELIASSTVGAGGTSAIDFTSIPSTYTDLVIKASLRTTCTDPDDYILIKPNNSTSSLTFRFIRGSGSGTDANTTERPAANGAGSTSSVFGNLEIYFTNYAGSGSKPFFIDAVTENNATFSRAGLHSHLWADSNAINRIVLTSGQSFNFVQHSTAYLYGVKNA